MRWLLALCALTPAHAFAADPTKLEYFETKVRPLLAEHCYSCHGTKKQSAGLRLDTAAGLKAGADDGPVVVPGDPAKSRLIKSVKREGDYAMPPKTPLPADAVAVLVEWVKTGAEYPADASPNAAGPDPRKHWAFQPVQQPQVPPGVANPIDAFVAAKLKEKGLAPAPRADKRTLIRRAYFDLTGLPPTADEVEQFVKNEAPDAYEKLVDRLLASPRYGERWGRYWLDIARYADTKGYVFQEDRFFAFGYTYRDYVIKSFNDDKPYDRFVTEQLAADLLPLGDDKTPLAAMGFLTLGRRFLNNQADIIDDRIDVVTRGLMGLTVTCARCHDHKYDPVSQEDYFRMQAFFAGFWPTEAPLQTAAERAAYGKKLAAWEAKTADVRAAIEKIEAPHRRKESMRQRMRFPEEYSKLLDVPFETRSPLEKQIAAMVEKQVYSESKDVSKSLKGAEKEQYDALKARLADFAKEKPPEPARALAMSDLPEPPPTKLLKRGDWRKQGEELVPGFIGVITANDAEVKPINGSIGRRTALANWIADAKNPLTARVLVNRLWQQHFGYGIVRTSSDFGVAGDRPTHPELLDWLASELVEQKWSMKHVHRLIVTSAAYKQGARGSDEGAKADIENKLLWQYPRRRLDGEALRDAMLAVSGQLNPKAGGPGVFPELPTELQKTYPAWKPSADAAERNRRSVYVFVKRNLRYPLFTLFDAPDRNETCARRFVTTTAPQALTLLNDSVVLGFAKSFATRVTKEVGTDREKVIERAFAIACGRPPTSEERAAMLGYLSQHKGTEVEAVTDLCHALLNLNEFLYVD